MTRTMRSAGRRLARSYAVEDLTNLAARPKALTRSHAVADLSKPARRILPNRKRDPHPGAILRGATRRTSAQVAADNKRVKERKRSAAELVKKKVNRLVEMEVQQQMDDEYDEQRAIKTISDLEDLESNEASTDEFSDDGGETEANTEIDGGNTDTDGGDTEIDGDNTGIDGGDAAADSDGVSSGNEAQAAPLKVAVRHSPQTTDRLTKIDAQRKKLERGETREMVDALVNTAQGMVKGNKRKSELSGDAGKAR